MDSVRSTIYYNRYCSTCAFRDPDVQSEGRFSDDCVHPNVLSNYIAEEYGGTHLHRHILAVECIRVLKYCEGRYYLVRKNLGRKA